jgi:hypothetical protein
VAVEQYGAVITVLLGLAGNGSAILFLGRSLRDQYELRIKDCHEDAEKQLADRDRTIARLLEERNTAQERLLRVLQTNERDIGQLEVAVKELKGGKG